MAAFPAKAPVATHVEPVPVPGFPVGLVPAEVVVVAEVTEVGAEVAEVTGGMVTGGRGGFTTVLPEICISAQALNVSCGPHPTAPVPSGQTPQLLPAVYVHCRIH